MNDRLNLQELIDLLAKKQDITKKDAEAFLRELIALISENIEHDPVKIKDFGTFKLVLVSARKSVDVNTGEAIEIPPHYKLSFIPDKTLREAVNRPFSHFESVLLEDGVAFENIEKEEADRLSEESDVEEEDIQANDVEEKVLVESGLQEIPAEVLTADNVHAVSVDDELHVSEGIEAIESAEALDEVFDDKDDVTEKELSVETSDNDKQTEELLDDEEPEYDEDKSSKKWYVLGFILLVAVIIGGLYFDEIKQMVNGTQVVNDKPVYNENKATGTEDVNIAEADSSNVVKAVEKDTVPSVKEEKKEITESKESVAKQDKKKVDQPLSKEVIRSGQTLRSIALKYYGHKSFWVYIYEENPGKIKNPNNVPLGTELAIPSPKKYGIDPANPQSVSKAKEKETMIFKKHNIP